MPVSSFQENGQWREEGKAVTWTLFSFWPLPSGEQARRLEQMEEKGRRLLEEVEWKDMDFLKRKICPRGLQCPMPVSPCLSCPCLLCLLLTWPLPPPPP